MKRREHPRLNNAQSKHRSRPELYYDILSAVAKSSPEGIGKTKLMYVAELSSTQTNDYLSILLEKGLIDLRDGRESTNHYTISKTYTCTKKGYDFLDLYERMLIQQGDDILKRRSD